MDIILDFAIYSSLYKLNYKKNIFIDFIFFVFVLDNMHKISLIVFFSKSLNHSNI